MAPTSEEMRAHRATHIPFRSWCPECVAGQGKDQSHRPRLQEEEEKRVKEVHFDYMFLRNQAGEDKATVIVGRCRSSKMLVAHIVPAKGESEEWVVK